MTIIRILFPCLCLYCLETFRCSLMWSGKSKNNPFVSEYQRGPPLLSAKMVANRNPCVEVALLIFMDRMGVPLLLESSSPLGNSS